MAWAYHTCVEPGAPLPEKPGRDRGLHCTSPGRIGCKTRHALASETLAETLDGARLSDKQHYTQRRFKDQVTCWESSRKSMGLSAWILLLYLTIGPYVSLRRRPPMIESPFVTPLV